MPGLKELLSALLRFGLLPAVLTAVGLGRGLPGENEAPRVSYVLFSSFILMPLWWQSTRAERLPALFLSGAFVILINRWLFGYGRLTGLIGLAFALLAASVGFRRDDRIGAMPRPTDWQNDWPMHVLMWLALIFCLYSLGIL